MTESFSSELSFNLKLNITKLIKLNWQNESKTLFSLVLTNFMLNMLSQTLNLLSVSVSVLTKVKAG